LPIWRDWADDVSGGPIASGHYLPEENPDAVLAVLLLFLSESDDGQDR
jgi:haloacetate dehalogenase